jgi:hypothetical protein
LTLGIAPKRAKPRWLALLVAVAGITLMTASLVLAGPVGNNAGFEDDDGNLILNGTTFDWNSFSPTTWGPAAAAPYRTSDKTVSGWVFKGIEDADAVTTDTAFAGGVKQDLNCPAVVGNKAPNKDDLKRIYLATKVVSVGGVPHTFLELAWVRIPQNTTSPSAHVAFEFNKGTTPCAGSGGLVQRTAGDMLIVYDFEGGTTDIPQLTLRRWVTSGSCEISSDSAPCWGIATNLTAGGFAEAKVNTFGSVLDTIGPAGSVTLGTSEFGEAGIDLTAAGVFSATTCQSFGKAFGVSRSSGNSGTAQMKDLVGPANFSISNCGTITVIKRTAPRGVNQSFGYTTTGGLTPSTFTLNDNGNTTTDSAGNTRTYSDVPAGSYSVTEDADPANFTFTSLTCTASGTGTSVTTSTRTANITIAGGGSVTCVYVNTQSLGAIKITKTSSKGTNPGLAGATFSVTKGGTAITGSPFTTDANGEICIASLAFGDYVVTETGAPTGYSMDDTTGHTVTVDNNANCTDSTYAGESIGFTDTPLSDIQVNFRDGGSGATSATISCDNSTGTGSDTAAAGWDTSRTVTGVEAPTTIICTITIDP